MSNRLIRTLLALEFLVAIEVWLTLWSEVGGQYDLDLMFWPWKLGLILAAAGLTVGLTAELLRAAPRRFSRHAAIYVAGLLLVIITAGAVTYYTWLNEPADDDGADDPAAVRTTIKKGTEPNRPFHSTVSGRASHANAVAVNNNQTSG